MTPTCCRTTIWAVHRFVAGGEAWTLLGRVHRARRARRIAARHGGLVRYERLRVHPERGLVHGRTIHPPGFGGCVVLRAIARIRARRRWRTEVWVEIPTWDPA